MAHSIETPCRQRRTTALAILLLVTVAIAVALWVAHVRYEQRRIVEVAIEGQGAFVMGDLYVVAMESDDSHIQNVLRQLIPCRSPDRLILGRSQVTDETMPLIGQMRWLQSLSLGQTQVTNKGLAALSGLQRLSELQLSHTQITDEGFSYLGQLPNLREVSLSDKMTPAGWTRFKQAHPHVRAIYPDWAQDEKLGQ
jgi:hypothetical protein